MEKGIASGHLTRSMPRSITKPHQRRRGGLTPGCIILRALLIMSRAAGRKSFSGADLTQGLRREMRNCQDQEHIMIMTTRGSIR